MKPTAPRPAAREHDSITSSLLQVRIIHYTSASPAAAAAISEWLHAYAGAANPARILGRMTRSGLLEAKARPAGQARLARQYSPTPKGRLLLETAKKHLLQLAAQ